MKKETPPYSTQMLRCQLSQYTLLISFMKKALSYLGSCLEVSKISLHFYWLTASEKKMHCYLQNIFALTIRINEERSMRGGRRGDRRKKRKERRKKVDREMPTYSPAEIKLCLSSFFIWGRPNFMFRGDVGDFCAEGWMKCAKSSVCFSKNSNLFARSAF